MFRQCTIRAAAGPGPSSSSAPTPRSGTPALPNRPGAPRPLAAAPPAAPEAPTASTASVLERAYQAPATEGRILPMSAGERSTPLAEGEARPAAFCSTPTHRAWIAAGTVGLLAVYGHAVGGIDDVAGAAAVAAATVAGYYAADAGTGVYHWAVDNYGDGGTPLVGAQIAAFQGHHQRPWTIVERQFANNCHQTFAPAAAASALWLAAAVPAGAPPAASAGFAALVGCAALSQQFHAWAHARPSTVPAPVRALQAAGLLVSPKAHGAHHRPPFEGNYCIVSGAWNGLLDGSGFFRGLERAVHAVTGVEPRCWSEPDYEAFVE